MCNSKHLLTGKIPLLSAFSFIFGRKEMGNEVAPWTNDATR